MRCDCQKTTGKMCDLCKAWDDGQKSGADFMRKRYWNEDGTPKPVRYDEDGVEL